MNDNFQNILFKSATLMFPLTLVLFSFSHTRKSETHRGCGSRDDGDNWHYRAGVGGPVLVNSAVLIYSMVLG